MTSVLMFDMRSSPVGVARAAGACCVAKRFCKPALSFRLETFSTLDSWTVEFKSWTVELKKASAGVFVLFDFKESSAKRAMHSNQHL